jgi:hypothetical protein
MLISHSSSSTNSTLRRRGRCCSTGVSARHIPLRLLQFSLGWVTSDDDCTSATWQNAAARLVFNLRPRDRVTPALLQLHWLPIQARITFKLCALMFQAHSGLLPSYLSQTLSSCLTSVRRPGLRSESSLDYIAAAMHKIW